MFMHSQKSKAGKAAFTIATSVRHLQKEKQAAQKSERQVRFILKKKKRANDQIYTNRKRQSNKQFFPDRLDSRFLDQVRLPN